MINPSTIVLWYCSGRPVLATVVMRLFTGLLLYTRRHPTPTLRKRKCQKKFSRSYGLHKCGERVHRYTQTWCSGSLRLKLLSSNMLANQNFQFEPYLEYWCNFTRFSSSPFVL
ncbi:uncharacterized protein EV420DRAFT_442244 [Desarmillaria tabescens]|uniref:Uncharacterized protein n=1 Tax=Armillaria tabescens TaxID=1929756 RepID=A0AA39NLV7_ARMTA|nr:uncharacterized protein EV420DRAFT_442244 [Desarmillaria tabescens]KAK0468039.1 hypothetical protein EV420DRAFT_442244 [Desarmillaria tabescens]